ncbi:MAG TPA: hypothetical protein VKB41_01790 [Steroidobacteraceae bacterium]|nr:hypothetical protein [Steroidobacteraceae bacterium]
MNARPSLRLCLAVACATLLVQPVLSPAQTAAPSAQADPAHDGQHDFDWIYGTWKATLKRLEHPLSGSKTWIEYEGTQISRSVWGGRGVMDDFKVDDAKTNTHINGFTLRLYNPDSHQWHIYWANAKRGSLDWPPVIGTFKNGRGEFYDQEVFEGHAIFVRYVWSDITPTSAHFEQSFSADGGRTWEANWISDITRVKE